MITTIDELKSFIVSDLYRGIYSLQAILLLRNSANVETIGDHIELIDDLDDPSDPGELMTAYAIFKFSRLSLLYNDDNEYLQKVSAEGSDTELSYFINSRSELNWQVAIEGAIESQSILRIELMFEKARSAHYLFKGYAISNFLGLAAALGNFEIMQQIIRNATNLGIRIKLGNSLATAAHFGQVEIVNFILGLDGPKITAGDFQDAIWKMTGGSTRDLALGAERHATIIQILIWEANRRKIRLNKEAVGKMIYEAIEYGQIALVARSSITGR